MTDITPLNGYVLLKRYVKPEKKGVILQLNENAKSQCLGIVEHPPLGISKIVYGDLVQHKPYAAIPVEGHDDYLLVKEEDILAILQMPKE